MPDIFNPGEDEILTMEQIAQLFDSIGAKIIANKVRRLEISLPWASPSGDETVEQDVFDLMPSGTPVCSIESDDEGEDMVLNPSIK